MADPTSPISPAESSHNPFTANFAPQAITPSSVAPSSPSRRRSSAAAKPNEDVDTCRICRGEATPTESLFFPCKCSGSIKYVHQDCLMEWLSHSQKKYCELCKTPFRFTKLYHPNMPPKLPTTVFLKRGFMHVLGRLGTIARLALVIFVWLMVLPYTMRMVWRTMFWFADGGWARDRHIMKVLGTYPEYGVSLGNASLPSTGNSTDGASSNSSASFSLPAIFQPFSQTLNMSSEGPFGFSLFKRLFSLSIKTDQSATNGTNHGAELIKKRYDSLLSDVKFFKTMTSSPAFNRVAVDILEGLMITLGVVLAFILVFLIREWVVQQQPILNMQVANVNHAPEVQAQEAEVVDPDATNDADRPTGTGEDTEVAESDQADGVTEEGTSALRDSSTLPEARQRAEDTIALLPENVRHAVRQGRLSDVVEIIGNLPEEEASRVKDLIIRWSQAQKEHLSNSSHDTSYATAGTSTSLEPSNLAMQEPLDTPDRPMMPTRERSFVATEIQRKLEESSSTHALDPDQREEREEQDSNGSQNSWQNIPDSWDDEASSVTPSPKRAKGKQKAVEQPVQPEHNDEGSASSLSPQLGSSLSRTEKSTSSLRQIFLEHNRERELAADGEDALAETSTDDKPSANDKSSSDPPGTHQENLPETSKNLDSKESISPDETEEAVKSKSESKNRKRSSSAPQFGSIFESSSDENAVHETPDDSETAQESEDVQTTQQPNVATEPQTLLEKLVDYFYGDLAAVLAANDNTDTDDEHVVQDIDDEAPFVPFEDAQPALPQVEDDQPPIQAANQGQDPEVAAAAAQAGIDVNDQDAIDDAEDLEGILELIGMQGPITGLFQNALFSAVLISLTVATAVWFPYTWGKMILLFMNSPISIWLEIPLNTIFVVEGFIADTSLFLIGAALYYSGAALSFWYKLVMGMESSKTLQALVGPARGIMEPAWERLGNMTLEAQWPADADYLHASMAAHAALNGIKAQAFQGVASLGNSTASFYTTATSGSILSAVYFVYSSLIHSAVALIKYLINFQIDLSFLWSHASGPVVSNPTASVIQNASLPPADISLAFWGGWDRFFAVLIGYSSFAFIGCIYLSWSPPLFSNAKMRQAEQAIIDILAQAGGVCKVILIISIEMMAFPLFCGFLLDLALLPLFEEATISSRVAFTLRMPWTSAFVHWFIGTCYMFHFALFVSMCRKIMRTGVLYFIRDPDDPTFHPVRDVLERSVATQLRKIAFSAIVYGALIVLCLGGVVWGLWAGFDRILPLHWSSSKSSLEFPLDILFYNFLTPILIKNARPSDGLHAMYKWWFKRCARFLRLSDFLFGERRAGEEGRHVRKSWGSWLLRKKGNEKKPVIGEDRKLLADDRGVDVYFLQNGRYVRAPASDQVRISKGEPVFIEVNENNTRKDGKPENEGIHAADSGQTKMVYIPPWFGARIAAFVLTIWFFAAVTGCGITVVPLIAGRWMCHAFKSRDTSKEQRVNDIYAFSLGLYSLGSLLYLALHSRKVSKWASKKLQRLRPANWSSAMLTRVLQRTAKYTLRVARIVYVYGSLVIVLPLVFSAILELYLLIPLHSLAGSTEESSIAPSTANESHAQLVEHTIHLVQDWTLGVLYVRIAARIILWDRESLLARAVHAIVSENGASYVDPSARLATRYFILPATIIFSFLLFAPFGVGVLTNETLLKSRDEEAKMLMLRMQYPIMAGGAMLGWLAFALARKMERWRGRIRDEVYLIGERLHNFGERRATGPSHTPRSARTSG